MEINKAVTYINDWNLLVNFVEHDKYGDICFDKFWYSQFSKDLGPDADIFFNDSDQFIHWVGRRITDEWETNGELWAAWNEYLNANEEYLPALRDW